MNICKLAYKIVRKNSDEIYKGFGFKHLSDATMYYVHPNNQSYKGTTTLCQPIGEGIGLFAQMAASVVNGTESIGDYFCNDDRKLFWYYVRVPEDWRENGIVDPEVYSYKASLFENSIEIGAYDLNGKWIDGNMDHMHPLYKYLPIIGVMLAAEMETDEDFRTRVLSFIDGPSADTFVNIHEDLYQKHKMDDYVVEYTNVSLEDTASLFSFSAGFKTIRENIESSRTFATSNIVKFADNAFSRSYKTYIPSLGEEFLLPEGLRDLCNALTNGDVLSVLFHGPAGTGKTMSCKLVAQEIGLPILETINCTENLDEFVLGKYIPKDDKIVFMESYVTKAIRDGGAVVFEEINFAKPQYLAFLNSLLDDNGFVRLDNGEVVHRNKNFRFFATMNLGYFGTKELNQALFNRFNAIIEIAELSDEAIGRMLRIRIPECSPFVDKMLAVYHKIKKKIEAEELEIVISPRNLENWARMAKYEGYIKAAEKTIIPIAKSDRVIENSIRGIIRIYKWK